jgi:hypothetical protein
MALNDITVLQEQADGSRKETLLTRSVLGADAVYSGYGDRHFGPLTILQNYNTGFNNSGYPGPGVTTTTTPSSYGFFTVGGPSVTINPFDVFGSGNFRIRATVRQTAAFGDGLHVMIRRNLVGFGLELGVPGLLDFGSGMVDVHQATSDVIAIPNAAEYYRVYFAAYSNGNGATPQDVTLTLLRA